MLATLQIKLTFFEDKKGKCETILKFHKFSLPFTLQVPVPPTTKHPSSTSNFRENPASGRVCACVREGGGGGGGGGGGYMYSHKSGIGVCCKGSPII